MSFVADCPFCGCAVKGISPFEVMEHLTECMSKNYGKGFQMPPKEWMVQNPKFNLTENEFHEWYSDAFKGKKIPIVKAEINFEEYEKWLLKIQGEEE